MKTIFGIIFYFVSSIFAGIQAYTFQYSELEGWRLFILGSLTIIFLIGGIVLSATILSNTKEYCNSKGFIWIGIITTLIVCLLLVFRVLFFLYKDIDKIYFVYQIKQSARQYF